MHAQRVFVRARQPRTTRPRGPGEARAQRGRRRRGGAERVEVFCCREPHSPLTSPRAHLLPGFFLEVLVKLPARMHAGGAVINLCFWRRAVVAASRDFKQHFKQKCPEYA